MTKGIITKSMLEKLEYDQESKEMTTKPQILTDGQPLQTATAMFIFPGSELNAAAYHLVKSMQTPLSAGAIASLFVQEGVLEQFINLLKPQLPELPSDVTSYAGFKSALETIKRLKAKIIQGDKSTDSALIVCDVTHEHLGISASGIITLHTFRTAKEAIALFGKESLEFKNATIWNENHSCAYELVAALHCCNFFINCHQVSLEPLKGHTNDGNFVTLVKSYHYETLPIDGIQKSVVFPVGTIFAN